MSKAKGIPSPCISVCTVDPFSGFCNGCFRTLDEIEKWPKMDDPQKEQLLAELKVRQGDCANKDRSSY